MYVKKRFFSVHCLVDTQIITCRIIRFCNLNYFEIIAVGFWIIFRFLFLEICDAKLLRLFPIKKYPNEMHDKCETH